MIARATPFRMATIDESVSGSAGRRPAPRPYRRHLMLGVVLAGLCMAQGAALAQSPAGSEEQEEGVPFEFVLPKGWTFNQEQAAEADAVAIFYPEGTAWQDSKSVIYLKVAGKKEGESVADLMNADSLKLVQEFPGIRINAAPSLRTVDGKTALVRHISGAKNGKRQAIAYIDTAESIILVMLAARGGEAFEGALEPFEFLAGALHFPE